MITNDTVERFLSGRRIAVIGASDEQSNFGSAVYRAFRDHGYDTVAVHPSAPTVAGDRCYRDLESAGPVDGAVVMVAAGAAAGVVRDCADHDVPRVWLFKGIGGAGAVSDDALQVCRDRGVEVVAGACPLMFLEPVGWFHRVHRSVRRGRGAVERPARRRAEGPGQDRTSSRSGETPIEGSSS